MTRSYSPLRYPGGKSKIYNQVEQVIKIKGIVKGTYIEPYAGGAGIAIGLLQKGMIKNVIINDYDFCIFAFWKAILSYNNEFIKLIEETPVTIEEWIKQKEIHSNMVKYKEDILKIGFSTFFLNRTNRSGIIKGGVIGGKAQSGSYKLNCRYNKKKLLDKIIKIGNLKDNIEVLNLKAEELIETKLTLIKDKSLIFFDPPYYKKGPGLYINFYKHNDHVNLERLINEKIRTPYIITYDNVEEINSIYGNHYCKIDYKINYSASKHKQGTEVLIFNPKLLEIDEMRMRNIFKFNKRV